MSPPSGMPRKVVLQLATVVVVPEVPVSSSKGSGEVSRLAVKEMVQKSSSCRKQILYAWLERIWPLAKLKLWMLPNIPVWYCRQSAGALQGSEQPSWVTRMFHWRLVVDPVRENVTSSESPATPTSKYTDSSDDSNDNKIDDGDKSDDEKLLTGDLLCWPETSPQTDG